MTTKAPSAIQEAPATATEKMAYDSVAAIPTKEMNDRNRLGYHVWRWLQSRQGTLDRVVSESGARILISHEEAVAIIKNVLAERGITF